MNISVKKKIRSFFLITSLVLSSVQLEASIKAIFWSKPTLFYQDRFAMFKSLGFWSSLFNAGRASEVQQELFDKLTKKFGAQTQPYKANDPETNQPLPLIMRQWLTNEKSVRDIRHAAQKVFKGDGFITKITDIVFTPRQLVSVTSVMEDTFKTIKKIKPGIMQILASNYDSASFDELKNSKIGKRILPLFKYVYNSGTLKHEHRGLVLQDPGFFKLIMHELHLKPEECLVVNSDPAIIQAAKSLGMQTLYYPFKEASVIEKQLKAKGLI